MKKDSVLPVSAPVPNQTAPRTVASVVDTASQVTSLVTRAEVTTVETTRSIYRFSNVGAAPISVVMKEYRSLSPSVKGQPVDLHVAGQSLLRYSLVVQRDTIPLSGTSFQMSRSSGVEGSTLLTYRTVVSGIPVAISYDISRDRYVVRTAGRVETTGPAYLLVEMPTRLPITEGDSLSDLRTLS